MEELKNTFFSDQEFDDMNEGLFSNTEEKGPVTVLGMTFANDEERRAYFREELRKRLPEIKTISGYPIGTDDDIINLSDPPFFTACPNPWLNSFIKEWENEKELSVQNGKRPIALDVSEPYCNDISVGKNNPIYNLHSYHTKVPHPAIMKLLEHYTLPGDIVYDGFAGTGMTGVACGMFGKGKERHCICNDLSPIASFIAHNLNNNTSQKLLSFPKLLKQIQKEYGYVYRTKHTNGDYGDISYVVWSDTVICQGCQNRLSFCDLFLEIGNGVIKDVATCPHCSAAIERRSCEKSFETTLDSRLGETYSTVVSEPYLITYRYRGKKYTKKPDSEDLQIIDEIKNLYNASWYPTNELGEGDKMEDPKAKGLTHIHQLYNPRTLFLLSKIWERCNNENWFCVTNSISRNLTKLNRFIVNKYNLNGRINGPLSGTLYVPSEVVEQNVFELLSEKDCSLAASLCFSNPIQVGDALHNTFLEDNSIDYIFTDPPFGANIMYSELNKITESWLRVLTNNQDEAIENKTQNKAKESYLSLMSDAFKDFYRVLKPGRWMSVEFSNTSAAVWNCIQTAIKNAGFIISSVNSFDKVHGGIKSMRYTTSVKEDLMITCYKPDAEFLIDEDSSPIYDVWAFVEQHMYHLPVHIQKENKTVAIVERDPKILFDRMISYYVVRGIPVPLNASEFQTGLRERYIERDGMFFTPSQVLEYEEKKKLSPDFIPLGLIVSNESEGIEWLRIRLQNKPQTYQQIQPEWMQAINGVRKNDIIPELKEILEENFILDSDGFWRCPNIQDDKDVSLLRTKTLLREFSVYKDAASKPKAKIKEVRVEAVRAGFKQCYIDKDFQTIVTVGDKIPQNLLEEDEILLQFYDIAVNHI